MLSAETLRQLVSDYYHGLIPRDTYRRRRAELLDGLCAGDSDDSATVPRSELTGERLTRATAAPVSGGRRRSDTAQPPGEQRKRIFAATAVAVLALLVTLLVALFFGAEDGPAGSGAGPAGAAAMEGDELLRDFLGRNDWSAASAQALLTAWQALDPAEHERVRQTTAYLAFANELRSQIRMEKNLADNDQDVARLDNGEPLLRALALGLGFDAIVATEYGRPAALRQIVEPTGDSAARCAGISMLWA